MKLTMCSAHCAQMLLELHYSEMHSMLVSLHKRITGSEEFDSLGDFVEGHTSRVSHRNGRHQSDYNSPPKA